MPDVILRPNAVISNDIPASGWPSGLTIDQVLSDNSILTRLRHVHSGPGTLTRLGMETYTLATDERIAGLQIYMQIGQSSPALFVVQLKNTNNMGLAIWSAIPFPTKLGKYFASKVFERDSTDGLEWTQTDLDNLEVDIDWFNPGGTFDARIYELLVKVRIAKQPTVEGLSPSPGEIIDTDKPQFLWRVQEGGGAPQNRYTLKVWTKAVVEGGGFDPVLSPYVGISSVVTSSTRLDWGKIATFTQPPLTFGGDYYYGVEVAVKFLNSVWFSEWSTPVPFSLNDPPTADVLTPTGAITDTNTPLVTWDYDDPEFNPQSDAQVKIFAQPGGTWVGFNPDTGIALFSGSIMGTAEELQSNVRLPNSGTYRAYVRVAHRLTDGRTLWGPWAFEDFTTNYIAPAAPTLTAGAHGDRVMITMTPPGGPWTPDIDSFRIERSTDAGTTWDTFRYGTLTRSLGFPDNTTPLVIFDPEVPLNKLTQYRAYSVSTDLGEEIWSLASNIASVTLTQQQVWLKDPADSNRNAQFFVEGSWLNRVIRRQRTFHQPLGRSKPLVTRGTASDTSFQVTLVVLGDDNWDKLMALVQGDRTLFMQTPKGSWYVEIAGDVSTQDRLWDRRQGEEDVWKITLPLQEVDFA